MNLWTACVENRKDPLKLGRCQVRVVGLHTHDKLSLPTEELPWAYPMQPINSAAISGIGTSPVGVVEGTWVIVMFRDEDLQQPIILGTIGGIPQKDNVIVDPNEDASISIDSNIKQPQVDASGNVVPSNQGYVTDSSGNVVTDGNGTPISSGESGVNLPELPVPGAAKPPTQAAAPGIKALEAAMDEAGITGKYGRAAILGICGGECGWIPQNEGYNYSAAALKSVFPKTFSTNDTLANRYARWKGTRESFFDFLYSPENNGAQLGNTQKGDGGRFFGRGFVQLTGRYNYTRYARLSGVDIINNPDLLVNDYAASAKVTVAFFADKVRVSSDDVGYFSAALKAVGGARSGWAKKQAYYQYFLGEAVPLEQTDKSTKPGSEIQGIPVAPNGLPADRQQNIVMGFSDPNMKYPLRQYIGEPDTNRLARGRIDGTIVEFKDEKRLDDVHTANGFSWSQPDIPYNAKYPYNKVMETESGHIMEFDDTPENERIHIYHRKGTYSEIDANGTQVNRIVGDGYEIIERNGYVFIAGECNLTVAGKTRIYCKNDAHIDVGANAYLNTAENFEVNVGKQFKVKADQIFMDATNDFNMSSTAMYQTTTSNWDVKASAAASITTNANMEINASGRANIEGSTVHMAEGAASAKAATKTGLGASIDKAETAQSFDQLKPPPRNLEADMEYETPEENAYESAQAYHDDRATAAVQKTKENPPVATESAKTEELPPNKSTPIKANCAVIYDLPSIPDSYVLHTDNTGFAWTLGMLTRGKSIKAGKYYLGRADKVGHDMSKQEIICNLKNLAENILGPINETVGKHGIAWNITSCYRNNIPSGGSATSQHLYGCAVDFVMGGNNFAYKTNYDTALKLASILPYDQLLLEYRDPGRTGNRNSKRINWIHVSYNNYGSGRQQALTFLNDRTYAQGFSNLGAA